MDANLYGKCECGNPAGPDGKCDDCGPDYDELREMLEDAEAERDSLRALNADLVAALELAKGTLVQCRDKFDRMGLDGDAYEWTATAHAFNTAAAALAKAGGGK